MTELRAVDEGAVPASAPMTSRLFVLPVAARRWVSTDNRSAVKAPLPSPSVKADAVDPQLAVAAAGPPPAMAAAVLDLAPVVNREGEVSGE